MASTKKTATGDSGSGRKATGCPICKQPIAAPGPAYPFCSDRCRLVDLDRWLDEDYRIPGPPAGDLTE